MGRRFRRTAVDPRDATRYFRVARALRASAEDLASLAEDTDRYGNAIAIVAIHSAVAYADALSIAFGGFKSAEGAHERAVDALREALSHRADANHVARLGAILRQKDAASYQGTYYTVTDARALVEKLKTFGEWAERMYEQRG
jgi:hypothetical protein